MRPAPGGGRARPRLGVLLAAALLLASRPGTARAATSQELFESGNAAYAAGRYQEAADDYGRILDAGVKDPRVYYNLGNAFFRLGRLGAAILSYERALRIDPTDREARDNLELARGLIRDRVAEPEIPYPMQALKGIVDALSIDQATLLFLLAYVLAGALLGAIPLARGYVRRRAFGYGAAAAGLLALIAVGGFLHKVLDQTAAHAIVMQERVDVRSGPAEDNTVLFTLHEGTRLLVRNRREGWCQISLPNALSGWVPAATLEQV
jgi:tetratricopeptide (TPR) repeat protein